MSPRRAKSRDAERRRDILLDRARQGDEAAREQFLQEYTPFMLRVAAATAGRYLRLGEDDEASLGLLALNEAIDQYDPQRGAGFLSFAELVIRRRLIDEHRKAGRAPLATSLEADEEGFAPADNRMAWDNYRYGEEAANRRDEIMNCARALAAYGLSWQELARVAPRHQDSRANMLQVGRRLAAEPRWREQLLRRGELPLQELVEITGFSRKTLERHRKYILAVAIIQAGDYPYLQEYLKL